MARFDYTSSKLGSKPDGLHPITICPRCGRNGQKRPNLLGGYDYLHTGNDYGFAISYGEYCSERPPNTACSRGSNTEGNAR